MHVRAIHTIRDDPISQPRASHTIRGGGPTQPRASRVIGAVHLPGDLWQPDSGSVTITTTVTTTIVITSTRYFSLSHLPLVSVPASACRLLLFHCHTACGFCILASVDESEIDIPVAPLADMVFLLLAFLVCVAVLKTGAGTAVDLPETAAGAVRAQLGMAEIRLSLDAGATLLEVEAPGQAPVTSAIDAESLRAILRAAVQSTPAGTPLVLRADARTPYAAVRAVSTAAKEAGAGELVIASRPATF